VVLGVGGAGIYAQHPENGLFFIATVTPGVDADSRKFTAFAPAFDCQCGNTEDLGNFGDGQEVGEIVQIKIFLD